MTKQPLRSLDALTLKTTYPDCVPYGVTTAGDLCMITTAEIVQLVFAANKLASEGSWELHGSPVHDGNRFHQWMVRNKRSRQPRLP